MKFIKYTLFLMVAALVALTGCQEQYVTYDDAEYVMFSDTLSIVPVENGKTVSVPVVSTMKCDHDRTFGVEILDDKSNAIENLHYRLKSNTITISAGEVRADVQVEGIFDSMEPEDSLCFTMKLLMNQNLVMTPGSDQIRVQLQKVYPFDLKDFEGWWVFTSMFHREFNQAYQRLVYSEIVEGEENTIRCKNMFNDGYDVKLSFDNSNVLNPLVSMPGEQIISDEATFFGQTKGDNHIRAVHSPLAPSNFFTAGDSRPYLALWSQIYVKNLGQMVGTVGHYYSIMERIYYKEAKRLSREDGMPGFNSQWGKPEDELQKVSE